MNERALTPAPRVPLAAAAAALAAVALGHLVGWGASRLLDIGHTTPDANIGAGIALILLPLPVAALLVWPLVRLLRMPRPRTTALVAAPLYLLLGGGVWMLWISAVSGLPPGSPLSDLVESLWTLAAAQTLILAPVLGGTAWFLRRRAAA
ncbi:MULTISPECIES: transporter [unclassified Nocardiopsis]|uniref:transporter n=1 Tax=unclassified Nocardiopsis TaxID=2649073 RepID=UPI0013575941|nr:MULTISPECIES: transporter [unclassified Nocardiopsis]